MTKRKIKPKSVPNIEIERDESGTPVGMVWDGDQLVDPQHPLDKELPPDPFLHVGKGPPSPKTRTGEHPKAVQAKRSRPGLYRTKPKQ